MDVAEHAHGLDDLRVAQAATGEVLRFDGCAIGLGEQGHGALLGRPRDEHLHQRADERHDAEPRVDERHEREKDQRCGRVEDRRDGRRRDELAQRAQVGESLRRAAGQAAQGGAKGGVEDPVAQARVKALAGAVQHARAEEVEQFHHDVGADDHGEEHPQRALVAAVHHAVVDLEHEPGRHQHEQAGAQAVADHGAKDRRLLAQCVAHWRGLRRGGAGFHRGRASLMRAAGRGKVSGGTPSATRAYCGHSVAASLAAGASSSRPNSKLSV